MGELLTLMDTVSCLLKHHFDAIANALQRQNLTYPNSSDSLRSCIMNLEKSASPLRLIIAEEQAKFGIRVIEACTQCVTACATGGSR